MRVSLTGFVLHCQNLQAFEPPSLALIWDLHGVGNQGKNSAVKLLSEIVMQLL